MRLLAAMFKHETNTFSPVPTPVERFFGYRPGMLAGQAAIDAHRGTGSGLGGFIAVAEEAGATIEVAVAAEAPPSGVVEDDAYEAIAAPILAAVRAGGFDAILLDLHGAMVTRSHEDGEGELLRRIRAIDPKTPVGVVLDMHANIYEAIVHNATVVTGYHTYPHVDVRESGIRAARIVLRALRGEVRPVMAWANRPMLPHVMRQGTHAEPNRSLQAACIEHERTGRALACSVFVGFPHADIREAGLSAVVCTDANADAAASIRDALLDEAWNARERFVYRGEPLAGSVARAKALGDTPVAAGAKGGPVVMLDHCDNVASGGTMDTTAVLAEVLRQGLEDVVFYALHDPESVRAAIAAGVGAEVTLDVGGKAPMPSIGAPAAPLRVTGTVKRITDGVYRLRGPMGTGARTNNGPTVVLQVGGVELVLISLYQEPFDLECFFSVGVDPTRKRFVVIKSRVHWRAGLGELAREVVECSGVGVTTSDYSLLKFEKVRRPVFPLDAI
ncbi:MAG: M81 family metallopeptidase [Burkholderiaceae bacterium]|nr:M81 family metallopeptidase [Burkholderiales bacterium]MCZ8096683.1 M81 family metallopeptidase [Burkholderiales bacterium]MCZ8338558.1 M81 family metallopeptidase [Burkholderiaceae bacterium]